MGEAKRKRSATQRLIGRYPLCYFCGGRRKSTTREHMPPKSLFDHSHRPDKLVMPACDVCNRGTSTADLTAALVSRLGDEPTEASQADFRKLVGQMRVQAPAIAQEWMSVDKIGENIARQHLIDYGVTIPNDARIIVIGPLSIRQLNLFAHKVTLALFFEHFRVVLPEIGAVYAVWRSKEDYASTGIPPALINLMPHYGSLMQGTWDTRETFEYRYAFNKADGLFGCIARLRRGLFTIGVAATDRRHMGMDANDWVAPGDPAILLDTPGYQKRE